MLLLAEELRGLELRVDDEWPAGGLLNDGCVLLGEAVVGQVLVRPLRHRGAVGEFGKWVDLVLLRHAELLNRDHPVLLPNALAELEVVRTQLRNEPG